MAIFAARKQKQPAQGADLAPVTVARPFTVQSSPLRKIMLACALSSLVAAGTAPAYAQQVITGTQGNEIGLFTGDAIRLALGFPSPIGDGTGTNTTPAKAIDFRTTGYGYIRNDYIGVVVGGSGTYSVPFIGITRAHNVAGMISFGNQRGSLSSVNDDLQTLNGLQVDEAYDPVAPYGWGVWPTASWFQGTVEYDYDYSSYVRARVDTTNINIAGATNPTLGPIYINGVLVSENQLIAGTAGGGGTGGGTATGGPVTLRQEIRLYRATSQMRWLITNSDSAAHSVTLRFTVPLRGAFQNFGNVSGAFPHFGFYFQDPRRGVSNQSTEFNGADVPETLSIYGKRYEPDNPIDPPFNARHIYRGFGATTPTKVYIRDTGNLRPNRNGFDDLDAISDENVTPSAVLSQGIASATYFGPYSIPPGGTQEVITYYGNGVPTESLNADFVTATEAPESLQFNSAAALNSGVAGNTSATPESVGVQFLSPNPFPIFGSVYNRTLRNALFNVNLNNVSMSLLLPDGLTLASGDTSSKVLGSNGLIVADTDSQTQWSVQPTGSVYGAVTYQVAVSTQELGSRTVSRVVNIPATPLHPVTASGFQMIGFPFQFDPVLSNNGDPATVINGLTSPRDEPVAFYQWNPDPLSTSGQSGSYQLATRLQPGIAYFYRPNLNRTIFANGVAPVAGQASVGQTDITTTTQTQILLERGWNMISNPYLYDVPLSLLRFVPTDNNAGATSFTFGEAINSGLVRGGIFFYDTAQKSYDFLDNLNSPLTPWNGYWLFTNSRVALVYTLPVLRNSAVLPTDDPVAPEEPATRARKAKKTRGAIASGRILIAQPTSDNWRLQLVAQRADGKGDRATVVGVSRTARANDNSSSLPKPPPPVDDYVYLGVVHPNATTRYAKDIQTFGKGVKTWDLELTTDKDGPVTLLWPNRGTLPKKVSLSLRDVATGRSISLKSASSLSVNAKAGQVSRFQIIAKEATSQPLAISNVQMIPTRAQGTTTYDVVVNLTQDAELTGRITTLSGAPVQTFAASRAATVGATRLKWDGRGQDGRMLPTGAYQVELTARDADGNIVRQKRPVTLIR